MTAKTPDKADWLDERMKDEAAAEAAVAAEEPQGHSGPPPWTVSTVWGSPQTGLKMRVDFVEAIDEAQAIGKAYAAGFEGVPLVMVTAVELPRFGRPEVTV